MPDETEKNQNLEELKEAHSQVIKNLVFSGGGTKGGVYPGAYQALRETGLLKGVENISGSSAGAIAATLIAAGIEEEELRKKLAEADFKSLQGSRVGISPLSPKDGKPLFSFINHGLTSSVKRFLDTQEAQEIPDEIKELKAKLETEAPELTFADFALLHKKYPETFKNPIIIAVKQNNGQIKIFSATDTPNVKVALACQASAALPFVMSPVEIEGVNYIDGGYYDNLPTEYFDDNSRSQPYRKDQTLVFAFSEGKKTSKNPLFQALYGRRTDTVIEVLKKLLIDAQVDDPVMLPKDCKKDLDKFIQRIIKLAKVSKEEEATTSSLLKELITKHENEIDYKKYFEHTFGYEGHFELKSTDSNNADGARFHIMDFLDNLQAHEKLILYQPNVVEKKLRNLQAETMQYSYTNTAQKERGYQKLR